MKSLEWVKEHFNEVEHDDFCDHRFTKRFLDYVPTDEYNKYGFRYTGEDKYEVKEWTEEHILAQLKDDCEFGIEKATNHRGISASLMYDVCRSWCLILENGLENIEYGWYGDKLFKAIDEYYHFGLIDENTFDKEFYEKW